MNFSAQFEALRGETSSLSKRVDDFFKAYAEAEDFTHSFLDECEKRGIDLVSIGTRTDRIKSSMNYPFEAFDSVFTDAIIPNEFPPIWDVVHIMDISGGCGNGGQHQISKKGVAKLVDGVYELKNGSWKRLR